jgi:enamine deaminase RidA (YjgF/YER057c/UK114 family)
MGEREQRLNDKGYAVDAVADHKSLFTPVVIDGDTAYLSGASPVEVNDLRFKGKVPSEVSVDEAAKAAELCAANLLRVFARDVGGLDKIERLIKVTGFVNSDPDFTDQHVVMNGASQLFIDVLGDAGKHARSAVGMASLPVGAAVEVELILKLS